VGVKVIHRRPHYRNDRFYGLWVTFDTGLKAYVAYRRGSGRSTAGYFQNTNAWCLDCTTLEHAKRDGVTWLAVVHDVSKTVRHYYGTPIEDYFGPRSGEHRAGDTRQRYLSRVFWRHNPFNDTSLIERGVFLKR
jgi:hypothetical protein